MEPMKMLKWLGCICFKESIFVKSREYCIVEKIGEGGYSTVYLVRENSLNNLFALKKIICHSKEDVDVALWEVKVHSLVEHDYVLRLVDYEMNGKISSDESSNAYVYLILPYIERGTLQHELDRRAACLRHYRPVELLEIFLKICEGVKAFHDCDPPLAHRDLKTANILLRRDDTPVIMDLGSTSEARVSIKNTSDAQKLQDWAAERCSMPYRAPELFHVEREIDRVDERTDIWSLGCILYALCFFKSPFDIVYEKGDSVALAVCSGNIYFPSDHVYGSQMEELIKCMLQINPSDRPFINEVIEKTKNQLQECSSCA